MVSFFFFFLKSTNIAPSFNNITQKTRKPSSVISNVKDDRGRRDVKIINEKPVLFTKNRNFLGRFEGFFNTVAYETYEGGNLALPANANK